MEASAELLPGLQSKVPSGTRGKAGNGNHHLQKLWKNSDASGECPALAGSLSGMQSKVAAAEGNEKMSWLWKILYVQIKREALAELLL